MTQTSRSNFLHNLGYEEPFDESPVEVLTAGRVERSQIQAGISCAVSGEHGNQENKLKKAGMMARRNMDETVTEEHVKEARDLVEADLLSKTINTLPDQAKLVLYTLAKMLDGRTSTISTKQVYDRYQTVAKDVESNVLGYQRVSDLLDELEFLDVTVSERKGRGDRRGIKKDHQFNHRPKIVLAATLAEDRRLQELESVTSPEDILQ